MKSLKQVNFKTSLSLPHVSFVFLPTVSKKHRLPPLGLNAIQVRSARCSSSGSRWIQRQNRDPYAREARVQGLKSRAAFKLLEMDQKYKLFRNGQTVVDLGYAPGSWSQVAVEKTRPHGRVIGIDLIPAQPPRGVASFQGDFLSPTVQKLVKDYIRNSSRSHTSKSQRSRPESEGRAVSEEDPSSLVRPTYIEMERNITLQREDSTDDGAVASASHCVDLVLSDMSAPWEQTTGFFTNTLSNPYSRLMNTSGTGFRDHAGSMNLCAAALEFAIETLYPGGHFVCKFYQGPEDKDLEQRLKELFTRVHREKPESSRSDSKEAFFVALRRKSSMTR